jgi:hypothetical protein
MSDETQQVSRRGGARPGAGRPVGSLDGPRGERVRRRHELVAIYTAALGGDAKLTDGQRLDVEKAATLTALAEAARELALKDGPKSLGAMSVMIRLQGSAERALRLLRLPTAKDRPQTSLSDYLASKRPAAAADG